MLLLIIIIISIRKINNIETNRLLLIRNRNRNRRALLRSSNITIVKYASLIAYRYV